VVSKLELYEAHVRGTTSNSSPSVTVHMCYFSLVN
jgi:hypothetical protein